jgi:hypothetical protein
MISGAIIPGSRTHGDGFVDMNVSATVRQPDADHIVVMTYSDVGDGGFHVGPDGEEGAPPVPVRGARG